MPQRQSETGASRRGQLCFMLAVGLGLATVLGCGRALAQSSAGNPGAAGLPSANAPGAGALPVDPAYAASLGGSVADTSGALVPGALVSIRELNGSLTRTARSGEDGEFRFTGLPPGTYALEVSATGFTTFTAEHVHLRAGEAHGGVHAILAIPTGHADVTVNMTTHELATEEVHAAEQQRVIGIFPNFYTSFERNPAPMNAGQKFGLALHATLDPVSFATAGIVAGGEQIENTFPEWGSGASGYAKRYGAAYADGVIGYLIGRALLPSVFHQDPRYLYMGEGTIRQRALHAIALSVIARGDNGHWEPNYSHILGDASAGALSSVYHPASDSAGKLALDNALIGVAGEAGVNLVREFILPHFTHGRAASVSAKP